MGEARTPVFMMSVGYGTPIFMNVPVSEADAAQQHFMEMNFQTAEAAGTVLSLPFAVGEVAALRLTWTSWRASRLTHASVVDKLSRYLLNPNHLVGGPKAKWFKDALGFTAENASKLAKQIRFDPAKAVETGVTQWGTKYNQVIPIVGANGRVIDVTFAWIRNNDGVVRLITAIPSSL